MSDSIDRWGHDPHRVTDSVSVAAPCASLTPVSLRDRLCFLDEVVTRTGPKRDDIQQEASDRRINGCRLPCWARHGTIDELELPSGALI